VVVERIVDERTIVVRRGGAEATVRLVGVARPREDVDRQRLTAYLEQLLIGEVVHLAEDEDAKPGPAEERDNETDFDDLQDATPSASTSGAGSTLRRYVHRAPDGLCVNLEVIRLGYAPVAARPDFTSRKLYRAYERRARDLKRGVWRDPSGDSREPSAAPAKSGTSSERDAATEQKLEADGEGESSADEAEAVYVTPSGKRYHRAGCSSLSNSARKLSLKEARAKYTPCKRCKPPE
jgi:hypothetical protein